MPSRVSATASSIQFTPSQSACSATTGATVSRPCPYAFALMTTINAVPGLFSARSALRLAVSLALSISIQESINGLYKRGTLSRRERERPGICYTTAPMPIVEFRKVGYAINGRPLVENISFVIESGETVVFLGRSGSGKTTTLKLINRLLEPTCGEVFVEGKKTTQWDAIRLRRRIGYVIQDVGLFPHFTVHRNVGLVPSLESWPPDKIDSRVHDMLSLVGLEPSRFAGRLPRELSGGQRQRVGVARALAADPSILLLDEPFGALDPVTRSEIQKEFRGLQKSLGKTMVFVTHDVREAFILGDRIGLMKDGNLIALVAVKDFHNLNHPEARAFVESYA